MKKFKKCALCLVALSLLGMTACSNSGQKDSSSNKESSHGVTYGEKAEASWTDAVVGLYVPSYGVFCTGTLIHPNWVLTAAHCVAEEDGANGPVAMLDESDLKIAFGKDEDEMKRHLHKVKKVYFNELYGTLDGYDHDIALIELSQPVPEATAYPLPVLTLENGVSRERLVYGDPIELTVMGYGYDEHRNFGTRLYTTVPLLECCSAANEDSVGGCSYYGTHVPFGTLYYEFAPGGSCNGDSGGPSFVKTDEFPGMAVASVTSYGDYGCKEYSVDTLVQDFYDNFILSIAPEVKTYHEKRKAKIDAELAAGECGDGLMKLCSVMSDRNEITACSVRADQSVECSSDCDGNTCVICMKEGVGINSGACENVEPFDPTSCRTYDGLVVENGQTGCFDKMLLATCQNGNWMDLKHCHFDTNTASACSNNQCKLTCKDGYTVDTTRASFMYEGDCLKETKANCEDETGDHILAYNGGWQCIGEEYMVQCVDGQFDMSTRIDCLCDTDVGMCVAKECMIKNRAYYYLNTACLSKDVMATCNADGEWVNEITCSAGCEAGACKVEVDPSAGENNSTSCQTYDGLVVENGQMGCANDVSIAKCENGKWKNYDLCVYGANQDGVCKANKCEVKCHDGYMPSDDGEYCYLEGASCEVDSMGTIPSGISYCEDDNEYKCVDGQVIKGEPCKCDPIVGEFCMEPECPIEGEEDGYGCMSGLNCCKDAHTMATCFKGKWINEVSCDVCGEGDCEPSF